MASKTVVYGILILSLSVSTVADLLYCAADRSHGQQVVYCPGYCYISFDRNVQIHVQKCATADEIIPHEVNALVRKGELFVFVCNTYNCNNFHQKDEVAMEFIINDNENVCHSDNSEIHLKICYDSKKCEYLKNIRTGRVYQGCYYHGDDEPEPLPENIGKCAIVMDSGEKHYQYICGDSKHMCNNAHVCDMLELGKPSPYDQPPPGPAPPPGQKPPGIGQDLSPGEAPPGPGLSPNGPAANISTSSPKNTGTCFKLPTIATIMLVVGVYFTV